MSVKSFWPCMNWGSDYNPNGFGIKMGSHGYPAATNNDYINGGFPGEQPREINAYVNIPTNTDNGEAREVFELFLCPGDDVPTAYPASQWVVQVPQCVSNPGWYPSPTYLAVWYGAKFENWGSSYEYVALVNANNPMPGYPSHYNATGSVPFNVQTGTADMTVELAWSWPGLWGHRYDDVKDPAKQVVITDMSAAVNAQGHNLGYACDIGCWLFHGTPRDLLHNMGHVDGHVKVHSVPQWTSHSGQPDAPHFDNDQYKFWMPNYQYMIP